MTDVTFPSDILDRMVAAVDRVRDRLRRTAAILEHAHIPYAVVGGNAVATWVAKVDPSAIRNTQDVDILLRRSDLEAAKIAMEGQGFIYRHVKGIDMFLDGPGSTARDAVHILFAGEKVKPDVDLLSSPDVEDSIQTPQHRVVTLEALVRMKLTSFRLKDQVHLLDMIDVELVDASWPARLPEPLAVRLQGLLDNPDG